MAKTDTRKTGNGSADNPNVTVHQGLGVLAWGIIGLLLAIVPAALLLPGMPTLIPPWTVIGPIAWASGAGAIVTYYWSGALHKRIAELRLKLDDVGALLDEEKTQYPGRVPWMPAWVGIFERAFFAVLIGLDVSGGVTFIGVWVGAKLAGGWQLWSKGTTYGRAIFFSGLLGNAMSVLFGLIAGLVIKSHIIPTP